MLGVLVLVGIVAAVVMAAAVGGYFWWTSKISAPTKTVEIKPVDETENWKTYVNRELGFSLKYPNNWNQGDKNVVEGNIVVLTPAPVEQIGYQVQAVYIQVHNNSKHLTSMEYYNQVLKPFQGGSVCTNPLINTNVPPALKNLNVTIIEGMCGVLSQGPRMVVDKDNYIVDVSSSFTDKVDSNLIYQILSTFKFVDKKDTSETLTVDFSVCQVGRKSVDVAFGSTTYEIIGKKSNTCEINYGGEVENPNWDGKLNTNCLVPTTLGKVKFGTTQYGVDFLPIKNYCLTK